MSRKDHRVNVYSVERGKEERENILLECPIRGLEVAGGVVTDPQI